jgi:hypothetical protein
MKLLLDQALPRSVARLLREDGIDCVHVGEIGYSTAEDDAIYPEKSFLWLPCSCFLPVEAERRSRGALLNNSLVGIKEACKLTDS